MTTAKTIIIAAAVAVSGLGTGCQTVRNTRSFLQKASVRLSAAQARQDAACRRQHGMSCAQVRQQRMAAAASQRRVAMARTQPPVRTRRHARAQPQVRTHRVTHPRRTHRVSRSRQVTRARTVTRRSTPIRRAVPARRATPPRPRSVFARRAKQCGRIRVADMGGTMLIHKRCLDCVKARGTYAFESATNHRCVAKR